MDPGEQDELVGIRDVLGGRRRGGLLQELDALADRLIDALRIDSGVALQRSFLLPILRGGGRRRPEHQTQREPSHRTSLVCLEGLTRNRQGSSVARFRRENPDRGRDVVMFAEMILRMLAVLLAVPAPGQDVPKLGPGEKLVLSIPAPKGTWSILAIA